MDTFKKLETEHQNVIKARLNGEKLNFSNLRKATKEHSEVTGAKINYNGTDLELWRSTCQYFREILFRSK